MTRMKTMKFWGPEGEAFLPENKKYRPRSPTEEPHFLRGAFIHLLNVRSISFWGEPVHQKIVLMRTRHKKTSSIINLNQGQRLKIIWDLTEWKEGSEKSKLVSVYLPWEDARRTANKCISSGGVGNPRSVHTHAHTHEHWRPQSSQSALPAPAFNFSQHHQWKCLCKTERIMSVTSTKRTSFKVEKRETEPLLGTRWSWHVWGGTPIENPLFHHEWLLCNRKTRLQKHHHYKPTVLCPPEENLPCSHMETVQNISKQFKQNKYPGGSVLWEQKPRKCRNRMKQINPETWWRSSTTEHLHKAFFWFGLRPE